MPVGWAYDHVIGSEFRRWNRIIGKKFGGHIRMLDLGCGPGGSSLWFAAQGHDVIGIDACEERIEIARRIASRYERRIQQAGGRLRFECTDFFRYSPEKCDAIVSVKTLHHVPDTEALIVKYAQHLSPNGCFLVLDQVGCTNFSDHARKIASAFYPPGLCKTPWHLRQRSAVGAMLRIAGILKEESRTAAEIAADPLEGIGQDRIIPDFQRLFRRIAVRNIDPIRVLFVALDLKDWACRKFLLSPFIGINSILRLTGPCLEKGLVAHMEDFLRKGTLTQ